MSEYQPPKRRNGPLECPDDVIHDIPQYIRIRQYAARQTEHLVIAHKFDEEAFTQLLSNYKNKIENVVFLGGDWLGKGLLPFIKIAHSFNFSVCLYSGADFITELDAEVLKNLEWLKLGSWKADLGPLTSPTTNQRFYKLADGKIVDEIKFYGGNDRESF